MSTLLRTPRATGQTYTHVLEELAARVDGVR